MKRLLVASALLFLAGGCAVRAPGFAASIDPPFVIGPPAVVFGPPAVVVGPRPWSGWGYRPYRGYGWGHRGYYDGYRRW